MILGLTERIRVKLQNDKHFAELVKDFGIAFGFLEALFLF